MTFSAVAPITSAHAVDSFDCGVEALNLFLQRFALSNHAAGLAKTYVVTVAESPRVAGYYSLCASSVERDLTPSRVAKGTPRQPVPVLLLARLAVDLTAQGRGLGDSLLQNALKRCAGVAEIIGVRAILVHAKGEKAAAFSAQYDFEPSPSDPLHMMLLIKNLKKLFP